MLKRTTILAAVLLAGVSAARADYAAGLEAYIRGDYRAAFNEFRPLAEAGDPRAQFRLGELYAEGRAVPQDFVQAYRWFSLAAANGVQEAVTARDNLAARMTPQQVAQAQALATTPTVGTTPRPVSPPPATTPATTGALTREALIVGIQQELRRLGYPAGPVDGAMGSRTRFAIRAFQSDAGLAPTGEPSVELLARLRGTVGRVQATPSVQTGGTTAAPAQTVQQRPVADRRSLIREIQRELARLGFEPGPADGVMGPRTRQAIISYQQNAGLQVTAEPSLELLDRMRTTNQAAPAVAAATQLSRDEQQLPQAFISEIERELASRGYNAGLLDGQVDVQLRAAIRQYQRDAGITINGEVSQALLDHLLFAQPRVTAR